MHPAWPWTRSSDTSKLRRQSQNSTFMSRDGRIFDYCMPATVILAQSWSVRQRMTQLRHPSLGPAADVLRETRTLHPDDAEALTGGRLHHHPTLQAIDHRSAQLLQARHLGWDVVGLDVDVDAALMVHALDLDDGLVHRGLQHAVVAAAAGMLEVHRATQRLAPETGGRVNIGGPTVDQYRAETGMVHLGCLSCRMERGKGRRFLSVRSTKG